MDAGSGEPIRYFLKEPLINSIPCRDLPYKALRSPVY
jgi:hypothetical protein